jgi:hypothetical protein
MILLLDSLTTIASLPYICPSTRPIHAPSYTYANYHTEHINRAIQ